MSTVQRYSKLLATHLVEAFSKRNLEASYCETKEEALSAALALIPPGAVVSHGGSQTLREIGLLDSLPNLDCRYLDPLHAASGQEREQVAHDALASDVYFLSANAITQAGELVNVDGIGNRVAALAFGPKKVVVIAGMNKVVPTLDMALERAKHQAAQMICLYFSKEDLSFEQADRAAEAAIQHLSITSGSVIKGRVHVLLVGESLGF